MLLYLMYLMAVFILFKRERHEGKLTITSLAWDPRSNGEIAYTDMEGQMGMLTDVLPEQNTKVCCTGGRPEFVHGSILY